MSKAAKKTTTLNFGDLGDDLLPSQHQASIDPTNEEDNEEAVETDKPEPVSTTKVKDEKHESPAKKNPLKRKQVEGGKKVKHEDQGKTKGEFATEADDNEEGNETKKDSKGFESPSKKQKPSSGSSDVKHQKIKKLTSKLTSELDTGAPKKKKKYHRTSEVSPFGIKPQPGVRHKKDWAAKRSKKKLENGQAHRKAKPGTNALREIRRLQKSVDPIIPAAPFRRLAREISQDVVSEMGLGNGSKIGRSGGVNFKYGALLALQMEAEEYAIDLFDKANKIAILAGRVTVMPKDINAAFHMLNSGKRTALH